MKTASADAFPPELLASMRELGELRHFQPGELLIREGEDSDHVYALLSGELKVFTHKPNGRELVYNTLSPGEYFGELALDGNPRSASVCALSAGQCIAISGDAIRTLASTRPEFLFQITIRLIQLLRRATRKLKSVALDDVYERIRALVAEELVRTGEVRHLPRTLTQQQIANRIGSSREMVNHVFRDLRRGGFVARDPRHGMVLLKDLPTQW